MKSKGSLSYFNGNDTVREFSVSLISLHLATFSKITSADAVHLNDFGLELWIQRKSQISSSRSSTIEKLPLLIRLVVVRAKKRSMRFSQEHKVGTRCRWNLECSSSQVLPLDADEWRNCRARDADQGLLAFCGQSFSETRETLDTDVDLCNFR